MKKEIETIIKSSFRGVWSIELDKVTEELSTLFKSEFIKMIGEEKELLPSKGGDGCIDYYKCDGYNTHRQEMLEKVEEKRC